MAHTPGKNPYSLSIRIFSDGFSLYVHDEKSELLTLKHLRNRNDINELLAQNELKTSFHKTRVIVETGLYTLIPDLFSTDSKALLALQHPYLSDDHSIITNHIDGQGLSVVFATEPALMKQIRSVFPDIVPQLHLNTFLRNNPESGRVILWTRGSETDLMLFDQGKWMLMNSFNISSVEDIIYYTLNLYREFGLNRAEFALWAFGSDSSGSGSGNNAELAAGLKPFFANIHTKQQTSVYENYQW
jgi:hypothetical protein